MNTTTRLLVLCGTALALGLSGCQDRTDDTVTTPGAAAPGASGTTAPGTPLPAARAATDNLTLATHPEHGPYVADGAGTAVYALVGDNVGEACTDTCLEVWPPVLIAGAQPGAEAGLQPNLVSSIQRPEGSRQATYNNHPLYRYAGDGGAGRTTGHGVSDQWGQWYLLTPQGDLMPAPEQ